MKGKRETSCGAAGGSGDGSESHDGDDDGDDDKFILKIKLNK